MNEPARIPFRMHPRVFDALGADLVTSDIVAIIELVKNAYDAFARRVYVKFRKDKDGHIRLDIIDDGHGMTREVIEDVWCLVATPHKDRHPIARRGAEKRRVTGAKGLGRLSAARLGSRLSMLTMARGEPCWRVRVDWSSVSEGAEIAESYVACERATWSEDSGSGTRLRIRDLHETWDDVRISDLKQNLARLIAPFAERRDFRIFLSVFGSSKLIEVRAPAFLAHPKYRIRGRVDSAGNVSSEYKFRPVAAGEPRTRKLDLTWRQVRDAAQGRFPEGGAACGPFSFEIRAWDIGGQDTAEIADRFRINRSEVRKAIRAHKGISVYRDEVLVLPKSDNARDWLGLDLRRVSRVGQRLSTNQLVGYVSITADGNPGIGDTSDRERLVSTAEASQFQEILKAVVGQMENERAVDRSEPDRERPMEDLFEGLSADGLLDEIRSLSEDNLSASEAVPCVRNFSRALKTTRHSIERRFAHYSRLATVGTIAHMLVHEIRARTTAFGGFLEFVRERSAPCSDPELQEQMRLADQAIEALEALADTFLPLANRNFRRRRRHSVLEEQIRHCLALAKGDIRKRRVKCEVPKTKTIVAVDPGELDAIILNLVINAAYWMGDAAGERRIDFRIRHRRVQRVEVRVSDTGPGIEPKDADRVFWPGVTGKPDGIGMGLTVARQLVISYGGRMKVSSAPGDGAEFTFDLPLRREGNANA